MAATNENEKLVKQRLAPPSSEEIQKRWEKCIQFNEDVKLYDTVTVNENFFIGDQWKGVQANGLPTPMFNILQQVVNFICATITSDNLAIKASALPSVSEYETTELDRIVEIVNRQFTAIFDREAIVTKCREFLRNSAVDGDGCMYFWFDDTVENGQEVKGEIRAEVVDNTRVHFGNPNSRNVQKQPYIIISRRKLVDDVQYKAEQYHKAGLNKMTDYDSIKADEDKFENEYDEFSSGSKVTVLTYMFRHRETNTIWFVESTQAGIIREAWDTGYHYFPIVWLPWQPVKDCYHGRAMITGLIPNQTYVNKMFAMVGLSQMAMAFPKIIYNKQAVEGPWDATIGTAMGVNGNVNDVAKVLEGAPTNPQIAQFIDMAVNMTRSFLGASDVALGDSRPDNTSAIIALQRAAATPTEITKQNYYENVDEMGLIMQDIMSVRYGDRMVEVMVPEEVDEMTGETVPSHTEMQRFDFDILQEVRLAIKREVGASSYWSEMATQQTMDNLLQLGLITPEQYIDRLPNGYITKQAELIEELKLARKQAEMAQMGMAPTSEPVPPESGLMEDPESAEIAPVGGSGNGSLQRAINEEGV